VIHGRDRRAGLRRPGQRLRRQLQEATNHWQSHAPGYVGHNVLRIDPKTRKVTVLAHDDKRNQPNDLAIAPDGTLYASDPNWDKKTGQIWHIDRQGKTTLVAERMGTTNGIEVSPDGKTLYV
jgi:gluconolactonase